MNCFLIVPTFTNRQVGTNTQVTCLTLVTCIVFATILPTRDIPGIVFTIFFPLLNGVLGPLFETNLAVTPHFIHSPPDPSLSIPV